MNYKILDGTTIECCASAAAKSYGKDLSDMSEVERTNYVKKIWDKHYNVSEHLVKTIDFYDVPRFISMIIGAQRHITITEFSQRRRKVTEAFVFEDEKINQESQQLLSLYNSLIDSGEKLEDARKILPLNVFSDLQVTMNRETARDIAMMDRAQREASRGVPWLLEILESVKLAEILEEIFCFTCNVQNGPGIPIRKAYPLFEAWELVDFINDAKELEENLNVEVDLKNKYLDSAFLAIGMPLFSYAQFQRHRINKNFVLKVSPTRIPFDDYDDMYISHNLIRNHDFVYVLSASLDWKNFLNLRTHVSAQESVREVANAIKKYF